MYQVSGIICQGEGQQVSGFSGESTLGEHFTPRCEEKWPIKVPIFEGGPSIHPYFRGTLKKWSINTPIFQGEHFTPRCEEKVVQQYTHISGVP